MEHSKQKITVFVLLVILVTAGVYFFYTKNSKESSLIPVSAPSVRLITAAEYFRYKDINPPQPEDEYRYRKYDESLYLNKYPQVVRLSESCFEINLLSGGKTNLCSDEIEEKQGAPSNYFFYGYIPNFGYWFYVGFWEGSLGLLIDEKTGEKIKTLRGRPIVSPNGLQFISSSVDLVAGYDPNGFQVWVKSLDSYTLRGEYLAESLQSLSADEDGIYWGVSDPVWINDDSFAFIRKVENYKLGVEYDEYAVFSF